MTPKNMVDLCWFHDFDIFDADDLGHILRREGDPTCGSETEHNLPRQSQSWWRSRKIIETLDMMNT